MIKVLIVDDSSVSSQYLEYILNNDPAIEVIGIAKNGELAIDFLKNHKPDIITMDIDMPVMNGLEATREIMSTTPIPIIVVTASRNSNDNKISMEALASGALSIIEKPSGIGHPNEAKATNKILTMVKIYSKVNVARKKPTQIKELVKSEISVAIPIVDPPPLEKLVNRKYVAIGISSGGPQVLVKIFSKITENFPFPILVVQHITEGFLCGMVDWLGRTLSIPVQAAIQNENLIPGHIYFAPDGYRMGVKSNKIELQKRPKEKKILGTVDYLFQNLSEHYGKETIAMILTGMGSDGAKEIKSLRDTGALTIAQDEESCLVFGMPGEAIIKGAIQYIQNPDQIANLLLDMENKLKK